jgi:hypothetical protein
MMGRAIGKRDHPTTDESWRDLLPARCAALPPNAIASAPKGSSQTATDSKTQRLYRQNVSYLCPNLNFEID